MDRLGVALVTNSTLGPGQTCQAQLAEVDIGCGPLADGR